MSRKQLITIIAVVAIIAAVAATAWFFFALGGGEERQRKKKAAETPPSQSNFSVVEARGVDAQDRSLAAQKATEVGGVLASSLNEMYTHAFLRPDRWGGGTESPQASVINPQEQLSNYFSAEARPTVPANAGALALAELGPRFLRIDPTKQEIRVSVLVEPDTSASFAVVSLVFEAQGTTKVKEEGPVTIVHNATYWFVNDGDALRILAYNVELRADTVAKTATFGTPPKGIVL